MRRSIALAVSLILVTGCSGGATSSPAPSASTAPAKTVSAHARATIFIPDPKKTSSGRARRAYVSPSTQGLIVAVSQVTGGVTATYSDTGYDLSAGATDASCGAVGNGFQCTIAFDAPPTSGTQTDTFSIYAYDTAQTSGPIASSYVPAGKLLSEDIGSAGAGDPVPSAAGTPNAGGIAPGSATTALTFVLDPVVATTVISINGTSTGTLVLSAPGSGGSSNAYAVDGYDADGNPIASYLAGAGDDEYVNPIAQSASPSAFTTLPASITSALHDAAVASYAPGGYVPASASATTPLGTIVDSDSLSNGGYGGASSLPLASMVVYVAPLFAFAPTPTATATGFTTTVYALQNEVPTGETAYTLVKTPTSGTNDCSQYTIGAAAAGAAGTSQQATFAISTAAAPAAGTTCTLTLSDSISSTPITFSSVGVAS